jgi:hypothetical protein
LSIIFEHPAWLLLPGGIAALLLAIWLYRSDKTTRHLQPAVRYLLGSLRFLALFTLIILLLKPLIKTLETEVEAPLIVVAQDNSESLLLGEDSTYINGVYKDQLLELAENFDGDYELKTYTFGEQLSEGLERLDYSEQFTNFSGLFDELFNKYSHRNLGAVIIASDGLYNKGEDPSYSFSKLNVPIYTIALGDTVEKKDLLIRDVAHNRLAYLGNLFPLEIEIEAKKCEGENALLEVLRQGQVLFSKPLTISSRNELFTIPVQLEAKNVGLQRYTVRVTTLDDEVSEVNNTRDIFIDVLDSRQKILILSAAPHPDIAALRASIHSNQNYEVEAMTAEEFKGQVADYSLIVLHQLPSKNNLGLDVIEAAMAVKTPLFFISGAQTDFQSFNKLKIGYEVLSARGNVNDVKGRFADGFSLFQVSEEEKNMFPSLPPLQVPFGEFNNSPGISPVLNQSIGTIATEIPLLSFNQNQEQKIGVLAGEGLWRWRMVNYLNKGDHDLFNSFFKKLVQFLASKDDKRPFRVSSNTALLENEDIRFNAEVYDATYSPIPGKDISMNITDSEGNAFDYNFSPDRNNYKLNAGRLPVDNYRWEAEVNIGGKKFIERGEFSVSPLQFELINVRADHQMLYRLANQNGGQMIAKEQLLSLAEIIRSNEDVVSLSYERKTLSDLIRLDLLLWILVLLLAAEWLIRKLNGTY